MMKCIYCLQDKDLYQFKKREHVVSQCFGKFRSNLVLKNFVCDECNQYFGDRIELYLGRDSFESIERLRHGIKPKNKNNKPIRKISKIIEGDFKGAIVREVKMGQTGNILVEKPVQVGFLHKKTGCYEYFAIGKIPTGKELSAKGYEIKYATVILIASENELTSLISELKDKGINLNTKSEYIKGTKTGEIVKIETEITLDRVLMRGLCKIAFNYLAYTVGKNFILSCNFDEVRKFIRYDEGNSLEFIKVNESPILHDDQKLEKFGAKTTEGHLIIIGYKNNGVYSKLSLFNNLTYGIYLCKKYEGIYIPIKCGHHFDIQHKEVSKLFSINKNLLL